MLREAYDNQLRQNGSFGSKSGFSLNKNGMTEHERQMNIAEINKLMEKYKDEYDGDEDLERMLAQY